MHAIDDFGPWLRERREALQATDARFSLRQLAGRVGVQPSYLSKVERGEVPPPGEHTIRALARELGEDEDLLLALGGKVSSELQAIIRRRPRLFARLLREMREMPDDAVLHLLREVRDGDW